MAGDLVAQTQNSKEVVCRKHQNLRKICEHFTNKRSGLGFKED